MFEVERENGGGEFGDARYVETCPCCIPGYQTGVFLVGNHSITRQLGQRGRILVETGDEAAYGGWGAVVGSRCRPDTTCGTGAPETLEGRCRRLSLRITRT